MKTIIITTQAELDALPEKFSEWTEIEIKCGSRIEINKARGNSQVTAWGNSQVTAWENSQVTAWGNSQVTARENSQVTARGNSQVTARENSQVTARENSQVTAWGNSQVTAWGNSQVTAWENNQVTAWENSQVTAWGNSQVTAWGNSQVTAYNNVCIHNFSESTSLTVFSLAVVFLVKVTKNLKKTKTNTIIIPKTKTGVNGWLETQGIQNTVKVVLYKKVNKDFKTQEGTRNETFWEIGKLITHNDYNPKNQECGEGKFHACSQPYFCDEFRDIKDDKYIAIEIAKKDLYAWPNPEYPHKIAFRAGKVLYQCNKFGKKI